MSKLSGFSCQQITIQNKFVFYYCIRKTKFIHVTIDEILILRQELLVL